MAQTMSAVLSTLQAAEVPEPRTLLEGILRNVAASAEGAVADASGVFSTDFPAAGAIDGDQTHINAGAAADADNAIGLSTWKSGSAGSSASKSTAAEFAAGSLNGTKVVDASVELDYDLTEAAYYAQTFDGLVTGDLNGQDGWVQSAGLMDVETGTILSGTKSLSMTPAAGGVSYSRAWSPGASFSHQWLYRWAGVAKIHATLISSGGGSITVQTNADGTLTMIAGTTQNGLKTFVAGTDYTLKVWVVGTTVYLSVDGILVAMDTTAMGAPTALSWTAAAGVSAIVAYFDNLTSLTLTAGSAYQQDFDGLTAATALAGQDSWADGGGAESITVETAAAYGGSGKGVRLTTGNTAGGFELADRAVTFAGNLRIVSFRAKQVTAGGTTDRMQVELLNGATSRLFLAIMSGRWVGINSALNAAGSTTGAQVTAATWHRFVIWWDQSTPASSIVRIFMDGVQIHTATVDMTNVDTIRLGIYNDDVNTPPDYHFDSLRAGVEWDQTGIIQHTVDLTAAPSSARATLTFNGEAQQIERIVDSSSLANNDGTVALRDAAARTQIAQTILPALSPLQIVTLGLRRVGTPVGNVWLELRTTSAGAPTSTVITKSRQISAGALLTTETPQRLEFAVPWCADGSSTYALVLMGDFAISGTDYVALGVDGSAPGYAGGSIYTYNPTTWTADATRDAGFSIATNLQGETLYDVSNQDADLELLASSGSYYVSQGFKISYDMDLSHVQLWLKLHAAASFAAGDRIWMEIQSDDGAGKPSNTKLGQSVRVNPALIASAYQLIQFTMTTKVRLTVGTQYHLVLKANYAVSGTNHVDVGADNSSASYADGQRCLSDNAATPVWTATSTSDLIFAVLGDFTPRVRFDAAYSTNGTEFGTYAKITDNPTRAGSMAATAFTGETKRYWRIRAQLVRRTTNGTDRAWSPVLSDWTLNVVFATEQWLRVDLGSAQTWSMIELIRHPTDRGAAVYKCQHSPDGSAWTDITGYRRIKTWRKGGGSVATEAAGVITTSGDHEQLYLAADVTKRWVRVLVQDNTTSYAQVCEIKVHRVVDWTDRILSCRMSQEGDLVLRRIRARKVSLRLRNDDAALSRYRTVDYNAQLGPGVQLVLHCGYQGVATSSYLPMGIFLVENWDNVSRSGVINVSGKDLAGQMTRDVRPTYKQGKTAGELVEYLGNLCNVPSTQMNLDRTGIRVAHFAPENPQAWEESQKLAEAAGFSQLAVKETGELELRAVANAARGIGIETAVSGAKATFGPGVLLSDKMYWLVLNASGLNLVSYDLDDGTLATVGSAFAALATRALLAERDGVLYIVVWQDGNALASNNVPENPGELRYWKTSDNTFPVLRYFMRTGNATGQMASYGPLGPASNSYFSPAATLRDGHVLTWLADDDEVGAVLDLFEIDLLTYESTAREISGAAANATFNNLAIESNALYIAEQDPAAGSPGILKIYTLNPYTGAATALATVHTGSVDTDDPGTSCLIADGLGYLWVSLKGALPAGPATTPTRVYRIAVPAGTVTSYPISNKSSDQGGLSTAPMTDAGAAADGMLIFGIEGNDGTAIATARDRRRVGMFDTGTAAPIDAGALTLGASGLHSFRSYLYGSDYLVQGVYNGIGVFEVIVRRSIARSATAAATFSGRTAGRLLGLSVDEAPEAGANSRIINLCVVKSKPLVEGQTAIRVWEAANLPWAVYTGQDFTRQIEFEQPIKTPASPGVTVTFAGGAGGTTTLQAHPTQPTLTLRITADGRLTAFYVEAKPLVQGATEIGIAIGSDTSRNRYGIHEFEISNDYIADATAAGILASWVVARFGEFKSLIKRADTMLRIDLQMFDRITLIDDDLGLNRDYYITSLDLDTVQGRASWALVEV